MQGSLLQMASSELLNLRDRLIYCTKPRATAREFHLFSHRGHVGKGMSGYSVFSFLIEVARPQKDSEIKAGLKPSSTTYQLLVLGESFDLSSLGFFICEMTWPAHLPDNIGGGKVSQFSRLKSMHKDCTDALKKQMYFHDFSKRVQVLEMQHSAKSVIEKDQEK